MRASTMVIHVAASWRRCKVAPLQTYRVNPSSIQQSLPAFVMLSEQAVERLSRHLVGLDLASHYESFQWDGRRLQAAWTDREWLEESLRNALRLKSLPLLREAANQIHKWGFGSNLPASIDREDWHEKLRMVLEVWDDNDATRQDLTAAFASLHDRGVKIARVSKWLCFLDQRRFAIYDSRVSVALRECRDDNGKRVFPIVPRRPPVGVTPWPGATIMNPGRSADVYFDYITVIRSTARMLNQRKIGRLGLSWRQDHPESGWWPAHVEMALFMAGDVWPNHSAL